MPIYNFAVHDGGRLKVGDGTDLSNDAAVGRVPFRSYVN
jgi:hypothetical protein